MSHTAQRRAQIGVALSALKTSGYVEGTCELLRALGYHSPKTLDTGGAPAALLEAVGVDPARFTSFGGIAAWRALDVVFQVTGDELPALARGSAPATSGEYRDRDIDSFVFLALDLQDRTWTRRELVGITRELNRGFAMPAIILFRHGNHATLAVIDRRRNRRDATRDVVGGRISLVKDIDLARPHRAHLDILADLTLASLRPAPADFRSLYDRWLTVLSASELNKRFYRDLADWFAWASGEGVVVFPPGQGNGDGERQIGLIRLLTRLMFVWFVKQKDLVPAELFEEQALRDLLVEPPHTHPDANGYYLAVLQNLFFACLNTEMDERGWLPRDSSGGTTAYLVHSKLRQRAMFADADAALAQFARVPFLNGGLFDCLDVEIKSGDPRADRATMEGRGRVLRVDGFSEEPVRQPRLPNRLFFGGQPDADLSAYYGKRTTRSVPGLIDLFERYKFTVEENTPLEEEAALDPELLGKVFENLLASYNEDTKTTARNKSGSFYTPREVVDFMVDEALVAYLAPVLKPIPASGLLPRTPGLDFGPAPGELDLERPATSVSTLTGESETDERLRDLLSYAKTAPVFTDAEVDELVAAIERCRAIDPAVGSGAFPLGLLQKLVHVLSRLDPTGAKWCARNREPLEQALAAAERTPALHERADRVRDAHEKLSTFDASFDTGAADYARKLYLIEGCLHGVDIQPIAVQIAKLRCFIALAVEQAVDDTKPNRGVTPLPNLEMKFVAANALGLVASGQGQLRDPAIGALEAERQEVNAAFFSARNRRSKRAARKRILEIREALGTLLAASGFPAEDARALAAWDPFDANAAARFFDPEWMFGLGDHQGAGFDIVLANPPYVRQEKIEDYRVDDLPANPKAKLRADYATFGGTADLYVYFYERSVRLLKPGGVIAFITSNKWYRAGYGAKLRAWLSAETRLLAVIDFGDAEVFEAIAYPTIVVAQKRTMRRAPGSNETFRALNWTPGEAPDGFPARFAAEAFAMPQTTLLPSGWQLEPQGKRELLARLRGAGRPLGDWCNGRFYRGILTGLNEAFVIDGTKRAALIAADPMCDEIIKPFLRGRDVKRWAVEPADKWLIKIPSSENADHPWKGKPDADAERIFAAHHPAIYAWWIAEGMRAPLMARSDQGHYFWELRSCAYWAAFEEPKIVVAAIVGRSESAPDLEGYFSNNKSTIYIPPSVSLAAAVVNSSVADWFARQTFAAKQGGFLDFEPRYSGTIPIPNPTPEQEALITTVVDAILAGAQPRASLESLLNAFVYELFFPVEVAAAGSPFAAARDAGLPALSTRTGPTLARAAEDWSSTLSDPESALHRTLFALQSLEPVRIIEGRT
ncbi:Eco57I restriction-modification methylase domain-containing protein [Bosea sp. LjRoot9]|uniref:Eco57I restriction-modification methylase domain-containing protein n=1 Tax=Bosea sp. LjRoot9 TaxID=3342341 RepID=UPI003ECF4E33